MRKRIFLLLPEAYEDADQLPHFPKTVTFLNQYAADYVILNVYEYFRDYCNKKKATELSLEMLHGFDELWYYGAFGITKPMDCILKVARSFNVPVKDLQPISCKDSFALVYKFILEFHPSHTQDETYWEKCIKALGTYTEDNNPLNFYLFQEVLDYLESIYRKKSPAVSSENLFKEEFRAALNFTTWAMKNNEKFDGGIDAAKVSKNPTPMLLALLNGFYKYYQVRQTILEMN